MAAHARSNADLALPVLPLARAGREVRDVTHVRSTWMRGSIDMLRARGVYDRYLAALPAVHHAAIGALVAGTWVDVELAAAHYEACDALAFSPAERRKIARAVSITTHRQFLALTANAAGAPVTPWTVLAQLDRLWERMWIGGAIGVTRQAEKEARLVVAGFPLIRVPYIRTAMIGVVSGLIDPACKKSHMKEREGARTPSSATYDVSWI